MLDLEKYAYPSIRRLSVGSLCNEAKLNEDLADFMLAIEGLLNHVTKLSKEETQQLLDKTKHIARVLIEAEEHYPISTDVTKEHLDSLFKMLSKIRRVLHSSYTKNVAVIPTPKEIKGALSAVSRASVYDTLSKK
jgi:hypothetical protein